ncbi:MAG: helix-turn-helix domain-containing protein [Bryobacteraceae bacterium]
MSYRKQRRPAGDVGRTIHNIRRRLDLNQTEFAERLGWLDESICRYELGKLVPSIPRLVQLLRLATKEEQTAILATLEGRGLSSSDAVFLAETFSATAAVSPQAHRQGTSASPSVSDNAPEASA